MPEWALAAREALLSGPVALVSIVAAAGSVPRGAGARMVVNGAGFSGSIGGGRLEYLALEQARKMLDQPPGSWRVQDYPLGPLLGQCCGGKVRLLVERLDPADTNWLEETRRGLAGSTVLVTRFQEDRLERRIATSGALTSPVLSAAPLAAGTVLVEPLAPPQRPVLLLGAGHVGQAIMAKAAGLPLAWQWADTRPDHGTAAVLVNEDEAVALAGAAPADAAVLILTHDHALDYRLVRAALAGEARFVGLIGSATKRARFVSRLAKDGTDPARLTCPVGLASVPGKEPEVIAIGVLAQLLGLGAGQ